MNNVLAIVVIALGVLLLASGISGNIGGLPSLLGITLPGTENLGPVSTRPGGPALDPNLGTFNSGQPGALGSMTL